MNSEKQLSNDDLQQHYANARATAACLGHQKAERNQALYGNYSAELKARGLQPDVSIEGVFNGIGSS